jgi:ketosteroid isomerase-like protein
MSQKNVEVARRSTGHNFNAFMRGEMSSEAYAEAFDPQIDVYWHDQQTYPDAPQHLRGVSELVEFAEQYRSAWDDLAQEPLELIEAADDRVLVFIRQSGRGRESGVPIVIHFFEVLTIRDGSVRNIEYFRHRADALEAAGLSEYARANQPKSNGSAGTHPRM